MKHLKLLILLIIVVSGSSYPFSPSSESVNPINQFTSFPGDIDLFSGKATQSINLFSLYTKGNVELNPQQGGTSDTVLRLVLEQEQGNACG